MSTEIDPKLLVSSEKTEKKGIWSKKERRILNLFAVLGLVNMLAYFLTQSSYVMQNIYWVYGIVTFIDGISFIAGFATWEDHKGKKSHPVMPARYKNYLIATGLWLISIPVVVISYFIPVISISLMDVANVLWGTSLVISCGYDTLYVMIFFSCWLTEGMGIQ